MAHQQQVSTGSSLLDFVGLLGVRSSSAAHRLALQTHNPPDVGARHVCATLGHPGLHALRKLLGLTSFLRLLLHDNTHT